MPKQFDPFGFDDVARGECEPLSPDDARWATGADIYRSRTGEDISDEDYNRLHPQRPERYIVDENGNVFKKVQHLWVLSLLPD